MMARQQLGLGTVQFGLDYGVSNDAGQVPLVEVKNILRKAQESGIVVLDTAAAYGESEQVIGSCLPAWAIGTFDVYTKTYPLRAGLVRGGGLASVVEGFDASLGKLCLPRVKGILVHHADDLLVDGGQKLYEQLREWKRDGRVEKLGVSVYNKEQIDRLVSQFQFDFMQLPINVFDQRLVQNGALEMLASRGIEIHARSCLLQGLLLMAPDRLPSHLRALAPRLTHFQSTAAKAGLTPLAACMGFVKALPEIAVVLIGVVTAEHLQECLLAYESQRAMDYQEFNEPDIRLIDPRAWAKNA